MRWNRRVHNWNWRFALLPIQFGGMSIWLEPYWSRFHGDHYELRLSNPKDDR